MSSCTYWLKAKLRRVCRFGSVKVWSNGWMRRRAFTARGTAVDDADLRQRQDAVRAQTAYREAKSRVAELINRYGEDAVLGWLKRGLPAEVRNSSTSSAATKSK